MNSQIILHFPTSALPSLLAHPLLVRSMRLGNRSQSEYTYFDTTESSLRKAGIVLSTHPIPQGFLQRVSLDDQPSFPSHPRHEWETRCTENFDFTSIGSNRLRKLLRNYEAELIPIFRASIERQRWLFARPGGAEIIVVLDHGKLIAGHRSAPISELVLELVKGDVGQLSQLAVQLAAEAPLVPLELSKIERGYRHHSNVVLSPMKAGPSPVRDEMTLPEAFQALVEQTTNCWRNNLYGALTDESPEYIHQYRVSLRRLGTLMKVFKPALPPDFADTWVASFKAVASCTSQLRDLDVMRDVILLPMLEQDASVIHQQMVNKAIAACNDARQAEVAKSGSQAFRTAPLLAFPREAELVFGELAPKKVTTFAKQRLKKLHQRTLERLEIANEEQTPDTAHRLRLSLKHLRYACEFFATVGNTVEMTRLAKSVARLQDDLGIFNDLNVTIAQLTKWSEGDPILGEAKDYVTSWHARQLAQQLKRSLSDVAQIIGNEMPWSSW